MMVHGKREMGTMRTVGWIGIIGLTAVAWLAYGQIVLALEAPPLPTALLDLPVVAGGAATNLTSTVACSQEDLRKGLATLTWTPAGGSEQRVVVTIYDFESDRFEDSDPLPADKATLVWDRVHGRGYHFWLVLTRQGASWAASEMATFEGPTCVANSVQ